MKIDKEKIIEAFPEKAWAYAEQYDSVKIGKWNGNEFVFHEPPEEKYLLVLRVFDANRELKFTGDKRRDTADYTGGNFIEELAAARYYMYGEHAETDGEYTKLWEDRGGVIYFPAKLVFPGETIGLKLGIRNFVRYNPVPVLPKGENYDAGLGTSGAGALEVVDYSYTGFFYAGENGKAVEL